MQVGLQTEMRYLREWIGKTRRDRSRNSQIKGILNQEKITEVVDRRKFRCFGYLIMMDSKRKPRQVWETRFEGMEWRVRPRIEWEEHMWKLIRRKVKGRPCWRPLGWWKTGKHSRSGWWIPMPERATRHY